MGHEDLPVAGGEFPFAHAKGLGGYFKELLLHILGGQLDRIPPDKGFAHGIGTGIAGRHFRIGTDQLDVIEGDPQLLGDNLDDHMIVALPVIDNPGDDRGPAVLIQFDQGLGAAPDAHGKAGLHRITADTDAVIGRQLAPLFFPAGFLG